MKFIQSTNFVPVVTIQLKLRRIWCLPESLNIRMVFCLIHHGWPHSFFNVQLWTFGMNLCIFWGGFGFTLEHFQQFNNSNIPPCLTISLLKCGYFGMWHKFIRPWLSVSGATIVTLCSAITLTAYFAHMNTKKTYPNMCSLHVKVKLLIFIGHGL